MNAILFRMLNEAENDEVVSWTEGGLSFVIKDPNEFARSVLPRHFKHSNIASFVRQLNKYDFHKVKNTEETTKTYGQHVRHLGACCR